MKATAPETLLPLSSAAFSILLALADGERYGYGISKEVEARTGGAVTLGPGTLYRVIKQMLADGWIAEAAQTERRRLYRLTPWGRRIAQAEARRLSDLVAIARTRALLPADA